MKAMFQALLLCLFLTPNASLVAQRGMNLSLDFSGSVSPQGYINEQTIQKVHSLLSAHFQNDGDFVVLSYLFGNSAAVNNAKVYTMKIPTLGSAFRDSDSKLQTVSNRGLQTRVKKSLIDKIVNDIKAVKAPAAQKSEILEGLVHVKRSSNASSLHVVFFSDMIENSSIRRFMNARTMNDAENWSHEDAAKLKSMYRLPDKLHGNVKITCIFPSRIMDNREGARFIEVYWTGIFQNCFSNPTIEFQNL